MNKKELSKTLKPSINDESIEFFKTQLQLIWSTEEIIKELEKIKDGEKITDKKFEDGVYEAIDKMTDSKPPCKHEWVTVPNDKNLPITYKCSKCLKIKIVELVHMKLENDKNSHNVGIHNTDSVPDWMITKPLGKLIDTRPSIHYELWSREIGVGTFPSLMSYSFKFLLQAAIHQYEQQKINRLYIDKYNDTKFIKNIKPNCWMFFLDFTGNKKHDWDTVGIIDMTKIKRDKNYA
ncbi:hypothetical protein LCGC14_0224300 [marine sediment metagenome]|uniref:Uncharacterized protein n=1 Tax=marine sediment metagenome TaxID=412755 RepID=A0A0F9UTQ3_9ZZZZ